ncbi:PREDICTED: protein tweety homolog 1, partial [Bison bison bison]|uniref:Protein tweety homolog n=1 Tax=Bison bison bison TaxID=43346 RepID=A0A6P3HKJ4_BISBB
GSPIIITIVITFLTTPPASPPATPSHHHYHHRYFSSLVMRWSTSSRYFKRGQALLLVAALAGLGLGLSLIFIAVYLIRFCCCRPPEPPGAKSPPPGGGCVTWNCIAALLVGCAGIGVGFYGNSETSDGVSQLSSALLHANHTLTAIDHLVLEMVERLDEAVRTELTTLEEVLTQRTELVAAARGARRQAETVAQQLQGLAFWRGVPLSPLQVAEDVSFVEEYRWLAYVLLLLLELLVCLFTLLGLARQSKWLVIVMTVMSLLVLVLSWGSMGLEAATAVGLSDFCSSPDSYILNLTQEETGLGSGDHTSGLTPCILRPLRLRPPQDYGSALRGLCEDTLEGLLFLLLFSLLSAGALATVLCSLPRAWALFPPSDDYEDTDDDDPFNPQESKRFVQWQSSI